MRIGDWEVHPAAVMLPAMSGQEFRDLCRSIREHGLIEEIGLLDGQVLDGCNRLRACVELGVEPRFEELDPAEVGDPWEWVWAMNVDRRHLDAGRRAALRLEFDQVVAEHREAALERQRAALRAARPMPWPGDEQDDEGGSVVAILPPRDDAPAPKTREVLAARAGVSPRTAQKALSVAQRAPELHRAVCAGELTLERAYRESRVVANPEWQRHEAYYTPAWVVDLLLDSGALPDLCGNERPVVEPCVGDGAIVRAIQQRYDGEPFDFFSGDVRYVESVHDGLHWQASWTEPGALEAALADRQRRLLADACLVITNPPFSLAQQVVERAWELCPYAQVWILQRRTWHDQARAEWFEAHQPDELNISPRVRFLRPDGTLVAEGTDNTIHTWYGFSPGCNQPCPGPRGGISRTLRRLAD